MGDRYSSDSTAGLPVSCCSQVGKLSSSGSTKLWVSSGPASLRVQAVSW